VSTSGPKFTWTNTIKPLHFYLTLDDVQGWKLEGSDGQISPTEAKYKFRSRHSQTSDRAYGTRHLSRRNFSPGNHRPVCGGSTLQWSPCTCVEFPLSQSPRIVILASLNTNYSKSRSCVLDLTCSHMCWYERHVCLSSHLPASQSPNRSQHYSQTYQKVATDNQDRRVGKSYGAFKTSRKESHRYSLRHTLH
jgi:hypothetical protein